jgi:23S rRNA pseudouridine2457 synthase
VVLFNKPYGVLSQFRPKPGQRTLADYIQIPGIYPAGRLDKDSEGLLILTGEGVLQHRLAHPRGKRWKTYWVQVEGEPSELQLAALRAGVRLRDGPTLPARARSLPAPPLWPRDPPIRARSSVPTAWLDLRIREGRNRQVRRMTAAVGLPTLRLVRVTVGPFGLGDLMPGEMAVIDLGPRDLTPRRRPPSWPLC